ncbi:MAG: ferritin-like domain-containing protein [Flavobacteriales bacterium]
MGTEVAPLKELLFQRVEQLYSSEEQEMEAFAKILEYIHSHELKEVFVRMADRSKEHISLLGDVLVRLDRKATHRKVQMTQGILDEGWLAIKKSRSPEVLDAMLLSVGQQMKHFEIAGYRAIQSYARALGYQDISDIAKRTLEEEEEEDAELTRIARSHINQSAIEPNIA